MRLSKFDTLLVWILCAMAGESMSEHVKCQSVLQAGRGAITGT